MPVVILFVSDRIGKNFSGVTVAQVTFGNFMTLLRCLICVVSVCSKSTSMVSHYAPRDHFYTPNISIHFLYTLFIYRHS